MSLLVFIKYVIVLNPGHFKRILGIGTLMFNAISYLYFCKNVCVDKL